MQKTTTLLCLLLCCAIAPAIAQPGKVYTEAANFPPMPLGAKKFLDVSISGISGIGVFDVKDSCTSPFSMRLLPNGLPITDGKVQFGVEFMSVDPGDFRDTIILVRRGPIQDEIRVRLSGTAFRIERTDRVEFGDVMTGDTARRFVLVRPDLNAEIRWDIEKRVTDPFAVLSRNGPLVIGRDSLAFVFEFAPQRAEAYRDTILLVRIHRPTDKVLDTLIVAFSGNGKTMAEEARLRFANIMVGESASDTLKLDLPAQVRSAAFTYSVRVTTASGPISAFMVAPQSASKTTRLSVGVTCAPTRFESKAYRCVLYRGDGRSQKILDSTVIDVSVEMRPRPVRFTMGFRFDTARAAIGDTVSYDVVLQTTDPIDEPIEVSAVSFDIAYNPTVFVPIAGTGQSTVVTDDLPVLQTRLEGTSGSFRVSEAETFLTSVMAAITMGDADRTMLQPLIATITPPKEQPVACSTKTAVVVLSNVWWFQNGVPRYVNPFAGGLTAQVDPNPVLSASTLRVGGLAQGTGRLMIVDALGGVRAILTDALRAGKRTFTISSSGSADIVVPSGTYYARLLVEGSQGVPIHSIVRVFVVQ